MKKIGQWDKDNIAISANEKEIIFLLNLLEGIRTINSTDQIVAEWGKLEKLVEDLEKISK